MGNDRDGYEETEYNGEGNINTDIWTGGTAGNMESKNKSGIEGAVERFRHFVCFWRNSHHWVRASSFTTFLDHTQRRTTVGRPPLNE